MWLLNKFLKRIVHVGELVITDYDGTIYRYGTPTDSVKRISVRLMDKGAAWHIVKDPRVGAGEAYMEGRLVVEEGDIRDLVLLIQKNAPFDRPQELRPHGPLRRIADFTAARLDQINWKGRSRRNAEHTYNLTRRLYELFLDADRQYTCGYFRDIGNSLEQAQLDKKAHLAAKLNVKPGMRVLDIGCGWGGLALYLHRHYDVEVLGVALAPDQIAFCQERAAAEGVADHVRFELTDYRDVTGSFDRIINVGLIEHLGTPHYPGFFAKAKELLTPDGIMVSHCCGRMGAPGVTDKWTRKYIFPGGYIPALSELVSEAERHKLIVSDVEALRYHYAHTLEEWYNRTNAAKDEIIDLYDERFFRMWQFYLAGAEAAFRDGDMVNWQVQFLNSREAAPITRDYIFEEERRLQEAEAPPAWHLAPVAKSA